jgi:hypothetical protein
MSIWFCEMEVNCEKSWEELTETKESLVRHCEECNKDVFFIDSQDELKKAAASGKCVAFYQYQTTEIPLKDRFEIRRLYLETRTLSPTMRLGLPSSANSNRKSISFIDSLEKKSESAE